MKTYGLIWPDGHQELQTLPLDNEGNSDVESLRPRPELVEVNGELTQVVPEWQPPQVIPLIKVSKPETGYWSPKVVWFEDRVERQWTEELPPPAPVYTAEDWVRKYFTSLEVVALMRLEQNILQQGKTLGPKMLACKQWLESMMFAQPSSSFIPSPYSYTETSLEAIGTLSS